MSRNSEYFDQDQLQQYKEGTPQILKSHEPLLRETEDNSNVRALNFDERHLNEAYNSNPSNPEGPPPKVNKYKRQSTNNSNSNNKADGTETQMQTIGSCPGEPIPIVEGSVEEAEGSPGRPEEPAGQSAAWSCARAMGQMGNRQ